MEQSSCSHCLKVREMKAWAPYGMVYTTMLFQSKLFHSLFQQYYVRKGWATWKTSSVKRLKRWMWKENSRWICGWRRALYRAAAWLGTLCKTIKWWGWSWMYHTPCQSIVSRFVSLNWLPLKNKVKGLLEMMMKRGLGTSEGYLESHAEDARSDCSTVCCNYLLMKHQYLSWGNALGREF